MIYFAFIHPNTGVVQEQFAQSLAAATGYTGNERLYGGLVSATSPNVTESRNRTIELFLESDAQWYLNIDTDITFAPDAPVKLRQAAIDADAKMAAMICPIIHPGGDIYSHAFMHNEKIGTYMTVRDFDTERVWVDACGMGCNLIHRDIYEALEPPWHRYWQDPPGIDGELSHDIGFHHYAKLVTGEPVLYCTDIEAQTWESFPIGKAAIKAANPI